MAAPFRTILVPTDGSEPSQAAVRLAVRIARERGCGIAFCHAINYGQAVALTTTPYGVSGAPEMIEALNSEGEAIVADAAAIAKHSGLSPTTKVLEGGVVSAISRYAEEEGVDAIVMGTRGLGGLHELVLGSTAEGLVREASVPVFVTHARTALRADDGPLFKRILVAIDDSDPSDAAAGFATALAPSGGSTLIFSTIVDTRAAFDTASNYGGNVQPILDEWQFDAKLLLARAAGRARDACVASAQELIAMGEPIEEILRMASSQHADLIVMGTHGRRGLRRMVMGSVAEGVVRKSLIPVAVVRTTAAIARTSARKEAALKTQFA